MLKKSQNNKYIIWLYGLTAREYMLIKNYIPEEHFDIVDIQDDVSKFKEIENNPLFDKPDVVICDEQVVLDSNIRHLLYDAQCGIAKVTTRSLNNYAYTDRTFELTNEAISIPQKKGNEWVTRQSTMLEESLKQIVDMAQLANIAKLQKQIREHADAIKNNIDIDKEFHDGKSMSKITKEYLFKLANVLNSYISFKDNYTSEHSKRVATYSEALGIAMGLNNDEVENLILAANLHDIGKIAIPDAVITKTSGLTDFEFNLMKKHVELGTAILPSDIYGNIKAAIRGHHEKMDGSGYPDGLKGEEIPLFAQIMAIADSFDAMTSQRSYNKVKSAEEAFEDLMLHTKSKEEGGLGYHYNSELVSLFIKTIRNSKTIMEALYRQKKIADANYIKLQSIQDEEVKTKVIGG